MRNQTLLVFLRQPHPGRAKTRLIPLLGAEGACRAYRWMAERLLTEVDDPRWELRCLVEPPQELQAARTWLGAERLVFPQATGDLGRKLTEAFDAAFAAGARRVIAVGSDCPDIDGALLQKAFATLEKHDAVLCPAADGGYTLLGLARPLPGAFVEIPWSTPRTCAVTRQRLASLQARWTELPVMRDIDTPADLCRALKRFPSLGAVLGL